MKKIILFYTVIAYYIQLSVSFSQTLSPKVIATIGSSATGGGYSLSWTMGETFTATLSVGSSKLSQGEQQPEIDLLTGTVNLNVCAGGTIGVPFTATGYVDAANVFTVQLSNGAGSFASPINIGTVTAVLSGTITAFIPAGASPGAAYRIRVISANPVYTGKDNGGNIAINALPAPSISGAAGFCSGSSTILNAGSYSSYNWSTGATTQTISVNASGIYSVTVTNSSSCSGSASKAVTANANPNPSISGANAICPPDPALLNAGSGYTNYTWSTGATAQTITVNAPGTYTVTVTNATGCTGSISKLITSGGGAPQQPLSIAGNTTVCKNSTGTYSIPLVTGATDYTWSATSGASISAGQGTNMVTVTFNNSATSASLSVTANNACGTSSPSMLAYTITSALPSQPSTINGQQYGLCNATNIAYNCPVAANASSYLWTVPAGVTILSGQGTNAITVKFTSSFLSSGSITVTAQSGCGNSATTSRTLYAMLQQPVISGQNWACKSQPGLVYSVTPVTGATSYTWTIVTGSTLISGQGTSSITVNWGSTNGVIKCAVNNGCGSSIVAQLPVSFTCKEAGDNENFSELSLYPNPASTSATLEFDGYEEGKAQIAVYDLIGQQLLNQDVKVLTGNNQYKLDLAASPKGVYMVRVVYNGVTRNSQLVVQ